MRGIDRSQSRVLGLQLAREAAGRCDAEERWVGRSPQVRFWSNPHVSRSPRDLSLLNTPGRISHCSAANSTTWSMLQLMQLTGTFCRFDARLSLSGEVAPGAPFLFVSRSMLNCDLVARCRWCYECSWQGVLARGACLSARRCSVYSRVSRLGLGLEPCVRSGWVLRTCQPITCSAHSCPWRCCV